MQRNILLLISGCIFTVASLASIQAYLISNTYKLVKKEVNEEVKKQLRELENTAEYKAIEDLSMQKLGEFIVNYKEKRVSKGEFQDYIGSNSDSLSAALAGLMSRQGIYSRYNIGYAGYVTNAVIREKGSTDTIFTGRILALGNNVNGKDEVPFTTSTWSTNSSISQNDSHSPADDLKQYNGELKVERFYTIENWQVATLSRMAGLMFFSVILLAFVVGLFYLSIKNLITQKRIADIKADFINNITHEFQTPLATMDIAVKTLQRKGAELSPQYYSDTLSVIERQNSRLQILFTKVSEASVASDLIIKEVSSGVDYKEICEIVADFRVSHPQTRISCYQFGDDMPIMIDRFHLASILVNLLDNAVKYGSSEVNIDFEALPDGYRITVTDNGPGIPENERTAIFDKFYRIEKGNVHNTKGLGLGLFYVRQIVGSYRGTVAVSGAQEKGASFIITIPLA